MLKDLLQHLKCAIGLHLWGNWLCRNKANGLFARKCLFCSYREFKVMDIS